MLSTTYFIFRMLHLTEAFDMMDMSEEYFDIFSNAEIYKTQNDVGGSQTFMLSTFNYFLRL